MDTNVAPLSVSRALVLVGLLAAVAGCYTPRRDPLDRGGANPARAGGNGGSNQGRGTGGVGGVAGGEDGGGGGGSPGDAPIPSDAECALGELRCSGNAVEVCSMSGWMVKETCPSVCSGGACAGACKPTETHCGPQKTPETCNEAGEWVPAAQACPFVCTGNGQCTGDCVPGSKRCGGAQMLTPDTCDEQGKWVAGSACTNICSEGSCGGSCMPGTKRCGANATPETCTPQGTWSLGKACEFICMGEAVCAGVCKPGTKRCDGLRPEECNASGAWQAMNACPFLCTAGACTGVCQPSEKRCNGQTPQTCSATGQWTGNTACPKVGDKPGVCSQGACSAGSCPQGTNDCGNNQCRACCSQCCSNATCPRVGDKPGVCNNGSCQAGSCPQGTNDCGSNQCRACCAQCCNDGMCGNGRVCRNGQCQDACTPGACGTNNNCTSGARQCPAGNCVQTPRNNCGRQGDKVGTCTGNDTCRYDCPQGTSDVGNNRCCPPGQQIVNGQCRTPCQSNCSNAGATVCSGTGTAVCQSDGNGCLRLGNVTACSGGKTCQGNSCQCGPGREDCGGQCVDINTNKNHCGRCNQVCSGPQDCISGGCRCRDECSPAGNLRCNPSNRRQIQRCADNNGCQVYITDFTCGDGLQCFEGDPGQNEVACAPVQ